jgi:Leucine-rich repeat (LRR) protein
VQNPDHPVTRESLTDNARSVLAALAQEYALRALLLEGETMFPFGDLHLDRSFEDWDSALRRAPERLTAPASLRRVLDDALGKVLLKNPLRFDPTSAGRATEILREFTQAIRHDRLVETSGYTVGEWMERSIAFPPRPTGPTADDVTLRERVAALPEADRLATEAFEVTETQALLDLSPLAALPNLRRLKVWPSRVLGDLSPLARLDHLEDLEVGGPDVVDLRPLEGLSRLRRLRAAFPLVRDVGPLAALRGLEDLSLAGCDRVEDAAPLASLVALRKLDLSDTRVVDLAPLDRFPELRELSLSGGFIADFGPLARRTGLRELRLSWVSLRSLEVLRPLRSLVKLTVFHCQSLDDLSALDDLVELETLDLSMTPLKKLALTLPKLRVLNLFGTGLRAPPRLDGLPRLEDLSLWCNDVDRLDGMESAGALRKLHVGPSRILTDLSPLSGIVTLEELRLDSLEKVQDLTPLASLTGLVHLVLDGTRVTDVSPLANLTSLKRLGLPGNPLRSIEPLGRLPQLEHVNVRQCYDLESIRPLAACTGLVSLETEDCEKLRGPRTLEELRAPPKAPEQRSYPSAGVAPARPGQLTVFDVRNHLPRQPPERWSIPERLREKRDDDDEPAYVLDAEECAIGVALWSRDGHHMLSVQIAARGGPPKDKQVARLLRRFRACDPFVETDHEMLTAADLPQMRSFIARAHPASPDSWGPTRQPRAYLRVEAAEDARPSETAHVRNHLPSPLPQDWSERPSKDPDTVCLLTTPGADVVVWLRREDGSDVDRLTVSLLPRGNWEGGQIGDALAIDVLSRFRARGAFQERSGGDLPQAPGMRIFEAAPR